eukprot:7745851-Lingulodinium_polyedra.AAC.1
MAFAWYARRAPNARRSGGGQGSHPHHCVKFFKRYTMVQLRSLSTAATARIARVARTMRTP